MELKDQTIKEIAIKPLEFRATVVFNVKQSIDNTLNLDSDTVWYIDQERYQRVWEKVAPVLIPALLEEMAKDLPSIKLDIERYTPKQVVVEEQPLDVLYPETKEELKDDSQN